jgi:hypothetical protein
MCASLWSNYWLLSNEKTTLAKHHDYEVTTSLPLTTLLHSKELFKFNKTQTATKLTSITTTFKAINKTTVYDLFHPPSYNTDANYGLWEMCKRTGNE